VDKVCPLAFQHFPSLPFPPSLSHLWRTPLCPNIVTACQLTPMPTPKWVMLQLPDGVSCKLPVDWGVIVRAAEAAWGDRFVGLAHDETPLTSKHLQPQHAAACRSMPQHAAACRSMPQRPFWPTAGGGFEACRSMPQHAAACRSMPQPFPLSDFFLILPIILLEGLNLPWLSLPWLSLPWLRSLR
jgi:hypothetical protein